MAGWSEQSEESIGSFCFKCKTDICDFSNGREIAFQERVQKISGKIRFCYTSL